MMLLDAYHYTLVQTIFDESLTETIIKSTRSNLDRPYILEPFAVPRHPKADLVRTGKIPPLPALTRSNSQKLGLARL